MHVSHCPPEALLLGLFLAFELEQGYIIKKEPDVSSKSSRKQRRMVSNPFQLMAAWIGMFPSFPGV